MAKLNFSIALGLVANGFKQGLNDAKASLTGFANSVKSTFGMIAGAVAAAGVKAFAQECVAAYQAQAMAETKLATVMKQRMGVTESEIKQVMKLASAQQSLGVIGDEVQLAGAQQVATFLTEKKSLDALIPAMNNLLAQQKGLAATQGDAVNIGNLMGKVMQGQTSALKRVGISFDEAQEKVLKYGTEQERAAMLADVIKSNVGDMNAELAKTDLGKIQQMTNTLGDLKEQIGAAIAPLIADLTPSLTTVATGMANGLTNAIDVIKQNIQELVGFIAMQFAAIGLAKIWSSVTAAFTRAQQSIRTEASATATYLKVLDNQILTSNIKIENMKLTAVKKGLTEESAFYKKIKQEEAALAELTANREKAAAAATAAANKLAAYEAGGFWQKGMMLAGAATKTFMLGVKTAFRSFAPLLIFEAVFTVGMKVYDMLSKNSEGFKKIANLVGGVVFKAISDLASALGWVFDKLSDIFGLSGKGDTRSTKDKIGDAREKAGRDRNTGAYKGSVSSSAGGGSGSGTGGGKTTGTKTKSKAEEAADAVAKANEEYSKSILKAQVAADLATDKQKASIDAQESGLQATKTLYDAYAEAYAVTGNEGYLARMKELISQVELMTDSTEGAKEALDEMQSELEKQSEVRKNLGESLAKNRKTGAEQRDRTFDYRLSGGEKTIAELEFDLSKAEAQLDELKQYASSKCAEAIQALADAEDNVTDLTQRLNLEKVKQDVQNLQKELSKGWQEFGLQAWSAFKGTVNNINSLMETMNDPDASGWEKFSAVIDTLVSTFQTFASLMETINTIMAISTALKNADTSASKLNTSAKEGEALASASAAMGAAAETTGKATASAAILPFPANIAAIAAAVAAGLSVVATIVSILGSFNNGGFVGAYASGGYIQGAYSHGDKNLIGVARVNAGEAILNPMQQRNFMRLANGQGIANGTGGGGKVRFEIEGRKLVGVLSNENMRTGKIL